MQQMESQETWSSRLVFLMAAVGAAVGLGNLWKFPYTAGVSGGAAFVIVYIGAIALVAIPIVMAELLIGRRGRMSPPNSFLVLAKKASASRAWRWVGVLNVAAVFVILSFYSVIGGWTLAYVFKSAAGTFTAADAGLVTAVRDAYLGSWATVGLFHTAFMALTIFVVARGVERGLEQAVRFMVPALVTLMIVLLGYSIASGSFGAGLSFLFSPDFSKLTWDSVLAAMGQAFFTLSIGMGAVMAYGAYLPEETSIAGSSVAVAIADTSIATLAGLVIFPLVFANGLDPADGPGLVFITLPLAFGQMPGGQLFGAVMFLLLMVAALSSCLGGAEAAVGWIEDRLNIPREKGVYLFVGTTWSVGIATVMSLGEWSDFYPLAFIPALAEETIFDIFEWLAANILLLIGATLTAVFFGWLVPNAIKLDGLGMKDGRLFTYVNAMLRFVVPPVMTIALVLGLLER